MEDKCQINIKRWRMTVSSPLIIDIPHHFSYMRGYRYIYAYVHTYICNSLVLSNTLKSNRIWLEGA